MMTISIDLYYDSLRRTPTFASMVKTLELGTTSYHADILGTISFYQTMNIQISHM